MANDKKTGFRDPDLVATIAFFLTDFYQSFERADLQRMADGLSEDFSALFYLPSQSQDLVPFNKKSILEGCAHAFAAYAGRNPQMKVSHLNVLTRSDEEAIAFYELDFCLDGKLVEVALGIADLRIENGKWKMLRLYENKRR